ncbi:DEAD/DEAH box helicase family protein [Paenibacillus sp. GCM10027626]|uniref:TOTE conflict system archaeo-eukaryotic primase domain-containing protein n=1 Tax=Paenibacillus sp. GCM10027626 TaxID=3273411 RepID=UPI0036278EBE
MDLAYLEERLRLLQLECERLREENDRLRKRISQLEGTSNIPAGSYLLEEEEMYFDDRTPEATDDRNDKADEGVTWRSSSSDKIALFRSLFRGREDVYPVRWQNKAGKAGYSPACDNEWTAVCKKPQVKCSECKHQMFHSITDEVIHDHLDASKNRTIGIYPLLSNEHCYFIALDLDKKGWEEDAKALLHACDQLSVPAALERSRSGNGGHLWIFFEQALPAVTARKLGAALITRAMEGRHQMALDSYDRMFPNQDTLPKGGFGNLIALPLQGLPRKQGNSVFVNSQLLAYKDQWAYLSSIRRMTSDEVEMIIRNAVQSSGLLNAGFMIEADDAVPWETPEETDWFADMRLDSLSVVNIVLANMIYIEKTGLPAKVINRLIRLAAFQNPEFYKAQAMRLSTYGKPRVIGCADNDHPRYLALPRGCYEQLIELLSKANLQFQVRDERVKGNEIDISFIGELTMLQDTAARAMLAHDTGILSATTAFGKTVVASSIIATRKVSTLILVHRRELMEQWKERLTAFLHVPSQSIGLIGGGKDKRTGKIDIAVMQSVNVKGSVKDYVAEYGQIVVDECHHISAFSFEQILKTVKARYVFGLTATPSRKDGHQPIVLMQCGPIRCRIDARSQALARPFSHRVKPRYTTFKLPVESGQATIQEIYQLLTEDEARNEMVFNDLLTCLEQGRSPLLLSERTSHVEYFEQRLKGFAKNIIVLRGGMGKKQREAIRQKMAGIGDDEECVFIATGKLIGEGFDYSRLDTLFLALPISWSGTLQQYVGRLHRLHKGKKEVQVYDYIDLQVPMLNSMYKKRVKGYKTMGYIGAEL